jgi:hypothetical protein
MKKHFMKIVLLISALLIIGDTYGGASNFANKAKLLRERAEKQRVQQEDRGMCPVLTLDTLPKAACSTTKKPFKEDEDSRISYYNETPPKSCKLNFLGLKKMFQKWFKNEKSYHATDESVHAGEATCSYKLDADWKKYLNTEEDFLFLIESVKSPDQANDLFCPSLTQEDITDNLLQQTSGLTFTSRSNIQHEFKVVFPKAKGGLKGAFSGLTKNLKKHTLRDLTQKNLTITKPFHMECTYEYHSGSKPQSFTLIGSTPSEKALAR